MPIENLGQYLGAIEDPRCSAGQSSELTQMDSYAA